MIRIWLGLIVSAAAFVLVVASIDMTGAAEALAGVAWSPLGLAVSLVVAQILLVSYRWSILLPRPRSGSPVTTAQTIAPVLIGYLGNVALPARLGDAARAFVVARRHRLHVSETIGSVVLERLADTATGAVVALVLAVVLGAPAWVVQLAAIAAIGASLVVVVLSFVGLEGPVAVFGRWLRSVRPGLAARALPAVERLERGMRIQGRRPAVAVAAVLSLLNWILEGAIYWLVALSLGIEIGFAGALLVAAVTVLATAIPAAPGYVGTFELAAVAVTTALGVPSGEAFAFAVLVHAATVLPLAIGGLGAVLPMGMSLDAIRTAAVAAERASLAPERATLAPEPARISRDPG